MKNIVALFSFCCLSIFCLAQNPISHPGAEWNINNTFSDEFNAPQIDPVKWDINANDWGTWSWEPHNAYITDTVLTLQMVQETHVRGGKTYYFNSGISRHRQEVTYGYFETRIKASDKGQGSCPAFWLYSRNQPTPTEEGGVKYCEIDAVEIFQKPFDFQRLEMNLHARIIENGVLTWKRPGQGDIELTHNTWLAPWDPRDDYHIYGVWNRLDSIFWYVDGVERGSKKNYYWHLPMYPTVSMGLRTPYERYINGVRTVMPYPDSIPEAGFPTEMYCDYVRSWKTDPQLYADREKYYDAEFLITEELTFDCRFFAGNDEAVLIDDWNGMTCKLQEVNSAGTVVNEISEVDSDIIGEESGITRFNFSLTGLTPSMSLPSGHQYILKPVFKTSFNGGDDVFLKETFYPIQIVESSGVNDQEALDNIRIINEPDGISVQLINHVGQATISIFNMAGQQIINESIGSNLIFINRSEFSSGIYTVFVKAGKLQRMGKVSISN